MLMDATRVLDIFKEITRIPRESGHEEPMTRWIEAWAEARGLAHRTDAVGNVIIVKEAAPGKESVPTIVLQSHQDMVCEKVGGSAHDFSRDPIPYGIEDGWMIARDTTLGADDGIGIAASLALLESRTPMGRLECVFTISEETGMDGAFGMEPGFFSGRTLINLDSEDEGQLFIGCSGGLDTFAHLSYVRTDPRPGYMPVRVRVADAVGGHSGDDINKERANAVRLMVRFLYGELAHGLQLVSIEGGNKPNAIARECEAVLLVPSAEALGARIRAFQSDLRTEFAVSDPAVSASAEPLPAAGRPIGDADAVRLLSALQACPHGVMAMSQDIPGLVETSTNLAAVRMEGEDRILVVTSQRSAIPSARRAVAARVEACFRLAGAEVEHLAEYPGWKPDVHSHVLEVCVAAYRRLFGTDPEVKAIHAGLECGLFGEKFGDLDMISFGPTLRGVHAPGERLELASLDKFWALLVEVVTHYA